MIQPLAHLTLSKILWVERDTALQEIDVSAIWRKEVETDHEI